MANDLNRVLLIGRLVRDPEFKVLGGSSLVNFSLANNRVYMSNGEKKEETNYFDCSAWGKSAETLNQYAKKGKQLLVEGRLKQETWDTQDGKKASKIRIQVDTFQFLGGNAQGTAPAGASAGSRPETVGMDDAPYSDEQQDDDIPF